MSNDELRRMFETVLTAPPPDTADVDAIFRATRGRRHRRTAALLLSSAAVMVAVGVTVTVVVPGLRRQSASPAASAAVTANDGVPVTTAEQLLGSWRTVELDGQDVRDQPLRVTFRWNGAQLWCSANDTVNTHSGPVSVSKQGQFLAHLTIMTFVGPPETGPQHQRNPQAVEQATEARLVPATPTDPRKLLLLAQRKIIAVYTPAAD